MNAIAPHHQRAIDKTIARFSADPAVVAIIIAGSIAKGVQTDSSDVDVMIVLTDAAIEYRRQTNRLAECIGDLCDYPGGYIDVKYFAKDYLRAAADRGSEPTRNSFVGARCLFARDKEIETLLARVPIYPAHEKSDKILSFYAGLKLSSGFFWTEAQKRNDPYLRMRMASEIVLYGCRLILAHNERLFPCQKRLVEATTQCPNKPADFCQLLTALLEQPTTESVHAFSKVVFEFCDWGVGTDYSVALTRYIDDNEQWWNHPRPYIAEW